MNRPNFIIIGAMKCATSTLHEQLAVQPGIFMTTPKEPYFFSNDEVYERGVDWYADLYAGASPIDLCGESSTHYSKLPTYPDTLQRMCEHVPDAKLIYIMRHPVDRLVSQYMHEWRVNMISEPIHTAIDNFPILTDYSRYSTQLKPFLESYGPDAVLPVFFDRLNTHPQEELERVSRFIGYTPTPQWDFEMDQQNVASESMRANSLRDAIVFAPGISFLRKLLIPQAVRDRVKNLWNMKERPQLSSDDEARLVTLFDQDLVRLGAWLDVDLNCANFKEVTKVRSYDWHTTAPRPKLGHESA